MKYPENRNWDDKVFTMPNISRGEIGLIAVLKDILTKVRDHYPPQNTISFEGSGSKITLDNLCVRLRPMRLVVKTQTGWELSKESTHWLEHGDDLYLAAILCANIRFVAEVLYFLDTPRKSNELNDIAIHEYGLRWKTLSGINSRLIWLRQLGLVDYQAFSQLYSITETGKEFLKNVEVVDSAQIAVISDKTINEPCLPVDDWAILYCKNEQENLALRKASIGYIPSNIGDFVETIAEYLMLICSGVNYDSLSSYAYSNHNIKASSLRSFMTTLSNLGFTERITDTTYGVTEIADKWLQNKGIIEIACCLHSKFLFFFELLNELNGKSLTCKELAAIARVSYGFEKENISEIQKRISIFKTAKLVRNTSIDKYTLTERGKRLLKIIPVQEPKAIFPHGVLLNKINDIEPYDSFYTELRVLSRDSTNPDKFERAVTAAFEALGFTAEWLGGQGKTDVLIQAPGAPKYAFKATVDAKSTASGSVTDNLVDFDTLKEHRKKHNADFSIVVGRAFQNERLINRAIEHKVILLDVDNLEKLIRKHINVPIKAASYRKIFEKSGIADISLIDDDRRVVDRFGKLLHSVMDCLLEESSDKVTGGLLTERDVYRSLRNTKELNEPPSIEEVSNMLEFLASPLMGCIEKSKEGYYAVGSLSDAARIFAFYSKSCDNACPLEKRNAHY